ncbi:LruC domain-containing protein [Bacteroides sp.]|uniref:LruC domain-containing protein n=1 Tax=Bacteroides sp. TaxID=29523 RepID=UPI0026240424|nr:LruC domain-containing protein [Bacteroides sp.]MDD3036911.1 LruC domain-containing protein [Bacteroides sp.]
MQTNKTKSAIYGILCLFSLSGCAEKDLYQAPEAKPADTFFGFTTSSNCNVNLSYGFKNYQVVFELYAENPISEDETGNFVKTEEEPVYRGSTDANGVFNQDISIPSYITELYLYSDFLGTISPIKLPIENGKISFDQNTFKQNLQKAKGTLRSVTENGYEYPDYCKVLGDWDNIGCPTYLSPVTTEIDAQLLYNIHSVFIKPGGSAKMENEFPQYIDDNVNIEINIIKPAKIGLVMLTSTASKQNTVGYFTYPTNQKPTNTSNITPVIVYPRISTAVCNSSNTPGSMYAGDRVELKYWDGTKFVDEFPAGVSIAWFMMDSSFDQKSSKIQSDRRTFYSIRELNNSGEHRTIALKDKSGQVVAFGMEDATTFTPTDNTRLGNFGDAVFYLDFSDRESIETGGVEELPDTPLESLYTSHKGVLSFEDYWPAKGDYDMNDMVVEYKRDIYKSVLTGKVQKIVDTFVPKHNGATTQNGFGYQLTGISSSDIQKVTIESDLSPSRFMEGQNLEPGQNYPTIILFDDIKAALNKTFTVTIEVAKEKFSEQVFTPFFNNPSWNQLYKFNMNPFIIITSNKERGREAHIVKFPPTQKMDYSYFGKAPDASRPDEGLYYVNNENLPTGLQISGVNIGIVKKTNFLIPMEQASIKEAYPKFESWASSFGVQNSNWWKDPDMSKVITK